jgi:hypothetical protein
VGLTKGLQEVKDSKEEARMLCRQHVQMLRGFSAHLTEVMRCIGIEGLVFPSAPEDVGAILCFFGQLSDKLAEAATRITELIDAECQDTHLLQHPAPSPRP